MPPSPLENIQVVHGTEDSLKKIKEFYSKVHDSSGLFVDANGSQAIIEIKEYNEILKSLISRGVRRRILTEITPDNLQYSKILANYVELRHLEGIKGNFAISESEYIASTLLRRTEPVTELIYSNAKEIVEQHQYLFETLWMKAIPGDQRIAEIEQGIEPEFVKVINDGKDATEIIINFARSVAKEAQLILPDPQTMGRIIKSGVWDHLVKAADNDAEVRIISPITSENMHLVQEIMSKSPNIKILSGPASSVGLFIQDDKKYARIEIKDSTAIDSPSAIGLVIYSNSKNGVSSFKSIFDSLWKQAELFHQLQIANEKLQIHDKLQREFVNVAAHELRTPIQPILGAAEILESRFKPNKEKIEITKEDIQLVIRNAKRLEQLSSDILEVAKIEGGLFHLSVAEFDLNELIGSVIQNVREELSRGITENKVHIDFESLSGNIIVHGDKQRIHRVLTNMLSNAVKFTPTNGSISVTCGTDDSKAIVTVTDTGVGIDKDIKEKLFTKFATKSERGTGLGLYISKNIIEAHGGKIWGENKSTSGAEFTFTLPIARSR